MFDPIAFPGSGWRPPSRQSQRRFHCLPDTIEVTRRSGSCTGGGSVLRGEREFRVCLSGSGGGDGGEVVEYSLLALPLVE